MKYLSIQFLHNIASIVAASSSEEIKEIVDMITLEYFFVLLPGEYNANKTPTTSLYLQ